MTRIVETFYINRITSKCVCLFKGIKELQERVKITTESLQRNHSNI